MGAEEEPREAWPSQHYSSASSSRQSLLFLQLAQVHEWLRLLDTSLGWEPRWLSPVLSATHESFWNLPVLR